MSNYMEEVREALTEICRKPDLQITPEMRLIENFALESIDVIDLLFEIEQRTGIPIRIEDIALRALKAGHRRFNDISVQDLLDVLSQGQPK